MKKILLIIFVVALNVSAFGQTVFSGKVIDQQGKPVPFAFVRDSKRPIAIYTNNEGNFSLSADAGSELIVSAASFNNASVSTSNNSDLKIVLNIAGDANAPKKSVSAATFFQTNTNAAITTTGSLYLKSAKDEVHGSRYLFDKWVHGFAITPADSIIQSNDYLFNYDKISGELLFTKDQQSAYTADKAQVRIFNIFDDAAQSIEYEYVPSINSKQYVQVLAKGNKYKIYKQTITKFEANNYTTNGITTSGHNYDEYIDQNNYYVVKAGGQPQKLDLKVKSIKLIFASEPDKVKKFLSDNDGDIDENYLKILNDYMNK